MSGEGTRDLSALTAAATPLALGLGITLMYLISVPLDTLVLGGATPMSELYSQYERFNMGIGVLAVTLGAIVVVGLVAVVRRMPWWGHSWVGAGLAGVLLALVLLSDERDYLVSPTVDAAILTVIVLAGLAALVAAILRGQRQAGLFSIGVSSTLGLSICMWVAAGPFFRFDIALLAGPLGLLLFGLVHLYTRADGLGRFAALIGVGLVELGVYLMALRAWEPWLAVNDWQPLWLLPVVLGGLLLSGPLLDVLLGSPLRRRFSQGTA